MILDANSTLTGPMLRRTLSYLADSGGLCMLPDDD